MNEVLASETIATVVLLLHFLAAVTATGAVLATDAVNAFTHLRPAVATTVARLQSMLSLLVWSGLLVLSVTGVLLFLDAPELVHDGWFQLKMVLVTVVFLNGVLLNAWVAPRFAKLAGEWDEETLRVRRFRILAGIIAAISLIGWYATLIVAWFD